jgi:hypothetical protein
MNFDNNKMSYSQQGGFMNKLTQIELKSKLHYDLETGIFTWIANHGKVKPGMIAGTKNSKGYIQVAIFKKIYLAHRLAWFYIHNEWPKNEIDHINGIKNDNRLSNLRDIFHCENNQNINKPQKNNKTGYLGVSFMKNRNKYQAQICINGKTKHIGLFDTAEEAYNEYIKYKRKNHKFSNL